MIEKNGEREKLKAHKRTENVHVCMSLKGIDERLILPLLISRGNCTHTHTPNHIEPYAIYFMWDHTN